MRYRLNSSGWPSSPRRRRERSTSRRFPGYRDETVLAKFARFSLMILSAHHLGRLVGGLIDLLNGVSSRYPGALSLAVGRPADDIAPLAVERGLPHLPR